MDSLVLVFALCWSFVRALDEVSTSYTYAEESLLVPGASRKVAENMSETAEVLRIDKPHFTVRLYEDRLRIDLKGTTKNNIEEALENKPVLKETIGSILGMFIPLHVHLSEIDSVHMDEKGKVVLKIPRHRDVVIPLEPEDAKRLVDRLNQLIPRAKEKELERIIREQRARRAVEADRVLDREELSGGTAQPFPFPEPPGMFEERKKEVEEEEKREAEED